MLQRLLFGLVTVLGMSLVGCAHSPQQLRPQPKLTTALVPVGQGQPVVVRVVDGRPSPVLGTRGGLYPETSAVIVPSAKVIPKLQAQTEAAVRLIDSPVRTVLDEEVHRVMLPTMREALREREGADPQLLDDMAKFYIAGCQHLLEEGVRQGASPEEIGQRVELVRRVLIRD